jgi:hypothetical protein
MSFSRMYYLGNLSEEALSQLEEKYDKSRIVLEESIVNHPIVFFGALVKHCIANYGSNILYLIFPVLTSAKGLTTAIQVFFPEVEIPSALAYAIGGTISVVDVIAYTFFYSVWEVAIYDALDHIHNDSFLEKLMAVKRAIYEAPIQAAIQALKSIFHYTVLGVHNITGTMTELVFYLKPSTKSAIKWSATPITCYFGNEFYKSYTNNDYWNGIEFLLDKNRLPMLSFNYPSTSLEITLQYSSAVGLRAYPLFFQLSILSKEILGFWPHPIFVTFCAAIHSLFVYSKSSYLPHLSDRQYLFDQLLKDKHMDDIVRVLCHPHPVTEKLKKEIIQTLLSIQLEAFGKRLIEEEGRF